MPYLTGGFAWGHTHVLINDGSGASVGNTQFGWTAGAGVEFAVSGNWSAKLEYEYVDLNATAVRSERLPVARRRHRSAHPSAQVRAELPHRRPAVESDAARAAVARVRHLECARADHVPAAGLSELPFALCRAQQPARRRTTAGDMDLDRISRHATVGRRRDLFRSRTGAGFWPQRHVRPGRLLQWRGAKGRPRIPEVAAAALLLQADLRPRRRAGRRRRRAEPARRQARHRSRHPRRRPFCRSAISSTTTPMRTIRAPIS